jgi:hypothetical protein
LAVQDQNVQVLAQLPARQQVRESSRGGGGGAAAGAAAREGRGRKEKGGEREREREREIEEEKEEVGRHDDLDCGRLLYSMGYIVEEDTFSALAVFNVPYEEDAS